MKVKTAVILITLFIFAAYLAVIFASNPGAKNAVINYPGLSAFFLIFFIAGVATSRLILRKLFRKTSLSAHNNPEMDGKKLARLLIFMVLPALAVIAIIFFVLPKYQ